MAKKPDEIGVVTHYYDNIGVAVVDLKKQLKGGETVTFMRGALHFVQPIASMQIDHENVDKAKKGASVGVKVEGKVQPGTKVYRGELPVPELVG